MTSDNQNSAASPRQYELEIIATGLKSAQSQGSEVWISGLTNTCGIQIPHEQFSPGEGWERRESEQGRQFVSATAQPATLRWRGSTEEPLILLLGTHCWSGLVKIRWDGVEQTLDLYAEHGGKRVMELPVRAAAGAPPAAEPIPDGGAVRRNCATLSSRPPSVWNFINPFKTLASLWGHRNLIWQFTIRELLGRYKGSFLGLFWSLLTPLLMLAVYTFVLSIVWGMNNPWQEMGTSTAAFSLTMFCGLIVFNIFSECLFRAPVLIVSNLNYVKKVVFPLEILPLSVLGASLINAAMSLVVLLLGEALFFHCPPWTVILFPLALLPLIFLMTALGWLLSSLGVFFRDIGHLMVVVVQVLFYMTPLFYSIHQVPDRYRPIIYLNPLVPIVDDARRTILWGQMPNWPVWIGFTAFCFILMQLSYIWLMKTKRGFADVI